MHHCAKTPIMLFVESLFESSCGEGNASHSSPYQMRKNPESKLVSVQVRCFSRMLDIFNLVGPDVPIY